MISVILPSRARAAKLKDSLTSLLTFANEPTELEILVRVDEDDEETLAGEYPAPAHLLPGPHLSGYLSMDHYWNDLWTAAHGDWLFTWNDDNRMLTRGWDGIIEAGHEPGILMPWDNSTTNGWPAFPIIHRSIPERLGHLTPFPGVDTWMVHTVITPATRPCVRVPIYIDHQRPNNPKYRHLADATWEASRDASDRLCREFDHEKRDYWRALVSEDIARLREERA